MKTLRRISLLFLSVYLAFVGCSSSTKVVSTWKSPELGRDRLRRVLVVVPATDEALRRKAEDELVRRIPVEAVASYTFIPESEIDAVRAYSEEIRRRGFDAVIVFRVVSVDREQTWVPGMYPGPSYAYGGWPVYDSGHVESSTKVRVDTNVYAIPARELIWATTTDKLDPHSVTDLIDDVADLVTERMVKDGVFPVRQVAP